VGTVHQEQRLHQADNNRLIRCSCPCETTNL
jgi:hypothetical protein